MDARHNRGEELTTVTHGWCVCLSGTARERREDIIILSSASAAVTAYLEGSPAIVYCACQC